MSGMRLPWSQLNTSRGGELEEKEGMRPLSALTTVNTLSGFMKSYRFLVCYSSSLSSPLHYYSFAKEGINKWEYFDYM